MSLINKVLRDLEERDRAGGELPARPVLDGLRSAPLARAKSVLGYVIIITTTVVVIGLAGWWLGQRVYHQAGAVPVSAPPAGAGAARMAPAPVKAVPRVMPAVIAAAPAAITTPARPAHPRPLRHRQPPAILPLPAQPAVVQTVPGTIHRTAAPVSPSARARADYRRAITALHHGHPQEAKAQLAAALAADPARVAPRVLLAALEVQDGRLAAAHRLLATGLARHPRGLREAILQAQIDLRLQRPAAAVARLRAVGNRARGHKVYLSLLGAAAIQANQYGLAHRVYRAGVRRYPHDGALWVGLALTDLHGGKRRAARWALQRAAHCPLDPVLAAFVAHTLTRVGR